MSLSIDGIASGMNTSELVQQLMQIERRPITLMQQRMQTYQQRMDAWRDVNMRLASLETKLSDLVLSSTYEARKATTSKEDVVTASAKTTAAEGTYEIKVTQLAQAQRVASFRFDSITEPLFSDGVEREFTVNGATIKIDADTTLQDLAARLNETEEAGVRASIIDNQLVIENKETGVDIQFDDTDGVLQDLDLNQIQAATSAIFTVNGIEIERNSNTVEVVDGVTFTLKSVGDAVITVAKDVDGAVGKIKEFVDQLNSTMDFIGTRLGKDAVLQGDSTLVRLQTSLRMALMDVVDTDGDIKTLSAIGISFNREGSVELDESKLREVLEENSAAVYKLFSYEATGEGSDGETTTAVGIARRARELIRSYTQTDGVIDNRREMFEEQIESTKDSIERLEERLVRREERLYSQFSAMEQALAALQTQSTWLAAQLSQLSAYTTR